MIDRLYAALLHAYPRRFRDRYAVSMRRLFRARLDEARRTRSTAPFLTRALLDVAVNASLERRDALRDWFRHPPQEDRPMLWHSMWMDVRYALRLFVRAPAFTALAVAAMALGIGANSAIFTVVDAVLLRPLPYADPERLVMVWSVSEERGGGPAALLEGDVLDIRRAASTLARLEAFQANIIPVTLTVDAMALSANAVTLTSDTFSLLGREPLLGRTLRAGDRFVFVLSHGFWQRAFGGDPGVVGREVAVGNRAGTVVGVMPSDFAFPYRSMLLAPISFTRTADADLWTPMPLAAARDPRSTARLLGAVGRMKAGTTIEQVRAELDSIGRRLADAHPATNTGWTATAVSPHEQAVGRARPALLLLLAGVGVVLLMACVNVANLLLARSMRRRREMAVRAALGAGRGRLLRQTLTESVLLSLMGGAAAWFAVRWAIGLFVAAAPAEMPRLAEIAPDWRVLAFTAVLALLTGVATGVLPAFVALRGGVQGTLADGSRGSTGARRLRSGLVAAEVALALVLTVGAGLLVRSFLVVLNVDPGFRTDNLLTMQMPVPRRYDTPDKRREFYRLLFERLESIPGVLTVGGTTRLPLGGADSGTQVTVEGRDPSRGGVVNVSLRRAMHLYFAAMGMPVIRGRAFTGADGPNAPAVVMINETMARRVFPGEDPVGRRVRLGENAGIAGAATIVGIVGDVRHDGLESLPEPEIYIHYLQNPPVAPLVVVRTSTDAALLAGEVRAAAREIDPELRPIDIRTMTDLRAASLTERRFLTSLAAAFGLLALALAMVGVYGVMTLVVAERTQEMGIRLALGAAPGQVLGLVMRDGLRLTSIGCAAGLAAALSLAPLMANQLYGIGAIDPVTLAGVPALLLLVAVVACVVPARRAMRVDPVTALRYE